MVVSVLVLVGTVYLVYRNSNGFLPDEDQGQIFIFTEGPQGISFEDMMKHQMALNRVVMEQPWIDSFVSTAAGGNAGRIFARLKPRNKRKSAQEIIQELRGKLAAVPGINAFPQMLPTIRIGGQLTKSQYQFTLQSPDTAELYQDAPKLEEKLRSDPQFQKLLQDVTSDLQMTNPQVNRGH